MRLFQERPKLRDLPLLHKIGGILPAGELDHLDKKVLAFEHLDGAFGRLLAGSVTVEEKQRPGGKTPKQPHLPFGESRAQRRHAIHASRLVHRHHVHITLDDDKDTGRAYRRCRLVHPEEVLPFAEVCRLGRVEVFRRGFPE